MQTVKWGGPGWEFLNNVTAEYPLNPTSKDKRIYGDFFAIIALILPCIYCRLSYGKFIIIVPIMDYLMSRRCIQLFIYLIHNMVNDKLRSQGYLNKNNPTFKSVLEKYNRKRTYQDCGWDFIYAIIFNYPINPLDIDKYNYQRFMTLLIQVMPYKPVKQSYLTNFDISSLKLALNNRNSLTKWFYDLHSMIVSDLKNIHKLPITFQLPSYQATCDKYEQFRAACNLKAANSCRAPALTIDNHKH